MSSSVCDSPDYKALPPPATFPLTTPPQNPLKIQSRINLALLSAWPRLISRPNKITNRANIHTGSLLPQRGDNGGECVTHSREKPAVCDVISGNRCRCFVAFNLTFLPALRLQLFVFLPTGYRKKNKYNQPGQ